MQRRRAERAGDVAWRRLRGIMEREVNVHLVPELARPGRLVGGLAVVVDVLRATTSIVQALAAGCTCVRPCACVEEARRLAGGMPVGRVILAGERNGTPLPGFDLGNSPRAFTGAICKGNTLVFTTTNGTRALLRAAEAERVLVAAFLNYSAVCEQLRQDPRPVHILCAGCDSEPALEDTLLAGALVEFLCEEMDVRLNDGARLAWDCFENHGRTLLAALEISHGGAGLRALGYEDDVRDAAEVDRLHLVPELRREPLRVEIGAVGIIRSHWNL